MDKNKNDKRGNLSKQKFGNAQVGRQDLDKKEKSGQSADRDQQATNQGAKPTADAARQFKVGEKRDRGESNNLEDQNPSAKRQNFKK